jgi:hypothetical protein
MAILRKAGEVQANGEMTAMSLTSRLEDTKSAVRLFMDASFPNVRPVYAEARPDIAKGAAYTLKPAGDVPWGTIGTALDYRLRYYFAVTECQNLVAFKGAARDHPNFIPGLWMDCLKLMDRLPAGQIASHDVAYRDALFFSHLCRSLEELQPVGRLLGREDEIKLCRLCVILALYEEVFRMGSDQRSPLSKIKDDTLAPLLALPPSHWLDDLCALSWSFHENFAPLLEAKRVHLNPKFAGSTDVGGADADLILDGCLIDIKATTSPKLSLQWLYQLIGYVLLDYEDQYKIRSVAILYARQGFMLKWDLKDLLDQMYRGNTAPDRARLRDEFQQMIKEDHKRQVHEYHRAKQAVAAQSKAARTAEVEANPYLQAKLEQATQRKAAKAAAKNKSM